MALLFLAGVSRPKLLYALRVMFGLGAALPTLPPAGFNAEDAKRAED